MCCAVFCIDWGPTCNLSHVTCHATLTLRMMALLYPYTCSFAQSTMQWPFLCVYCACIVPSAIRCCIHCHGMLAAAYATESRQSLFALCLAAHLCMTRCTDYVTRCLLYRSSTRCLTHLSSHVVLNCCFCCCRKS